MDHRRDDVGPNPNLPQLIRLRKLLVDGFGADDLKTLCFDLGVDYDDLPGTVRSTKVVELLTYLDRRRRLPDLVQVGRDERPDIAWDTITLVTAPLPPEPSQPQPSPPAPASQGARLALTFEPSPLLTAALQRKLELVLASYHGYLQFLGFVTGEMTLSVYIQPDYDNAHYEPATKRLVFGPNYVDDSDVLYREYTHHALVSHFTAGYADWVPEALALESGLGDYFPCSFNDDPMVGEIIAVRLREEYGAASFPNPYVRLLDNRLRFDILGPDALQWQVGEVWGGAFWDIRRLLGATDADRLLFLTWTGLEPDAPTHLTRTSFVQKLLDTHAATAQTNRRAELAAIFEQRGVKG
ncbi:MAG: hypothetical protein KIT87_19535 [Anaerolineae bacterium]|nr:hypothetical protein [Anaerolineae bacterium]